MSQLIMNAILAEAQAKEAKALANLNNYMTSAVGVAEHPDVVTECSKLVKEIAEARETVQTLQSLSAPAPESDPQVTEGPQIPPAGTVAGPPRMPDGSLPPKETMREPTKEDLEKLGIK